MPLANLFLIGAPKAGTTSTAAWLAQHPDVFWSVPKEPYYWARDFPRQRAHYGFDQRTRYEDLYASPEACSARYRGDGSTTYLYSETAVPAILEEVPDARFIVCVRDPTHLVVSYHRTQLVALNEDEPDFATAWQRSLRHEAPTAASLDPKLVDYQLIGSLGSALTRLFATVPREQVLVVVLDDLLDDPAAAYRRMLDFLGLSAFTPDFAAKNASDKMYRSPTLRRLTHRPPRAVAPVVRRLRQWSRSTSSPRVARLKQWAWRPAERPEVSDAVLREVDLYFAAEVRLVEQLLDRPVSRRDPGPSAAV